MDQFQPIPPELAHNVPQLVVMVIVVSAVLLFGWRALRLVVEMIGGGMGRIEAALTRMAEELRALTGATKSQATTFDTLTHEVHAMSHHEDLQIGVPGGRFEPEIEYSRAKLQQMQSSDRAPWTHKLGGIDQLHARGIRGKGAVVVVIDTGMDARHEDLNANFDLGRSRSFTGEPLTDVNGHGTHCTGIVCADNQGIGTLGVAPDALSIHGKGLSDRGSGAGSWLAGAIRYCADISGHKIFSLSFGAPAEDRAITDAIRYAISKGHWVVAAAGNSGPGSINWPGALEEVVCVAATTPTDTVASFSSANDFVDVGWGGTSILSTLPNNRYGEMSGTSMATPGVAGIAALAAGELLRLGLPIPTQKVMAEVLYSTAKDIGTPGRDPGAGHGRVQPAEFIAELVRRVQAGQPKPDPKPEPKIHRVTVPKEAEVIEITRA